MADAGSAILSAWADSHICRLHIELELRVPRPVEKSRILKIRTLSIRPRWEVVDDNDPAFYKHLGKLQVVFSVPKNSDCISALGPLQSYNEGGIPCFHISLNLGADLESGSDFLDHWLNLPPKLATECSQHWGALIHKVEIGDISQWTGPKSRTSK